MRFAFCLTGLLRRSAPLGLVALVACSAPPPAPPGPLVAPRYPTSFDCGLTELPWQTYVCRDAELASQDRAMSKLWHQQLHAQDMAGRAELLASQRGWQRSLAPRCPLDSRPPAEDAALPAAPLACLKQAWATRVAALQAMPQPVAADARAAQASHPLAAYVSLRNAQNLEPDLCDGLMQQLNAIIVQRGELNPSSLTGVQVLAGSHALAPSATLPDGRTANVRLHDAGPYGSYETRAQSLSINGTRLIDDRTVPAWTLELPNAGGNFSSTSSQTSDYAAIDVFSQGPRTFVLVNQTWGYYASAARGESPHAALYELDAQGVQRRCLWRTYVAPPVARALRLLPQFKALQDTLDAAAGPESPQLTGDQRRDAGLLYQEAQWTMLNMPLLPLRETSVYGRTPLLRQRYDEALDAVFAWSERNVPSKLLYRRLMPLIPAAHTELLRSFQTGQGLKPDEARAAADLVLMAAVSRAAERLQDPTAPRPSIVGSSYAPRYTVATVPGELERARSYSGLHSALLGRAPADVIDELMRRPDRTPGPDGDTLLMAAVRSPAALAKLLAEGADVNARNAWGKTALMQAAQADQPESVQLLLQANADVQMRTRAWSADGAGGLDNAEGEHPGRTALMIAAAYARPAVIEALLARGADPKAFNDQHHTACDALADNPNVPTADAAHLRSLLCATAPSPP